MGRLLHDRDRSTALEHVGFTPDEIDCFKSSHLADVPLLQQCGVLIPWYRAVADWHMPTWFVVGDSSRLKAVTRTGTKPGDPLVDASF